MPRGNSDRRFSTIEVTEAALTAAAGPRLAAAAVAACRDAAEELPGLFRPFNDGVWALTDPDGLLFSNEAIATVFACHERRLAPSEA